MRFIKILILLVIMVIPIITLGAQTQTNSKIKVFLLTKDEIKDCTDLYDETEIYLKSIAGIDHDNEGHIYYMDKVYNTIYKIELKTLKLIGTISKKGVGPSELIIPSSLVIKKRKIFVLDNGFQGIKTFDLDGKCLFEKKFPFVSNQSGLGSFGFGVMLSNIMDINSHGDIFIRDIDEKNKKVISVFNSSGTRLKQIISLDYSQNSNWNDKLKSTDLIFKIDNSDNLILLYRKQGVLKKFSPNGQLEWERDLYRDLPPKTNTNEDAEAKVIDKQNMFQMTVRIDFIDFCFVNDKIFVSSIAGGMIYTSDGKPIALVKLPEEEQFLGSPIVFVDGKIFAGRKIFLISRLRFD